MNVRNTKLPAPRIEVAYSPTLNLQKYGEDNLYPQDVQRITSASGTAELCLARYKKFIEGNGFRNDALANYIFNKDNETGDDILARVADDVAHFGGYALHVNYNVLGEITSVAHVPFEQCRLEEKDDHDHVAHILVHADWSGRSTRRGSRLYVDEKHVARINVFNPLPDVVFAQIIEAGGIDQYKGQILWCSMAGGKTYPTPIYDAAITDISTDEGLGNIKYRNVRNNFLTACMLVTKKGVPYIDESGRERVNSMIDADDLRMFQGDENTSKILLVELENDEDKPEAIPFPSANYDKEFTATDECVVERIYAQFHQELFHAIRIGKLGFSGDVMRDAYEYYAGEVTTEQRFVERGFRAVLSHFANEILINADVTIQPLRYINSEVQQ